MGKAAKQRRSLEKKKEKKRRKLAQTALYEARRDAGTNSKSFRARKRFKAAAGKRLPSRHGPLKCGNVGCPRCNPDTNLPFLARMRLLDIAGTPHQFTSKYRELVDDYIVALAA